MDTTASPEGGVATRAVRPHSWSRAVGATLLLITIIVLLFIVAFQTVILVPDKTRLAGAGDMDWYFGPIQFFYDSHLDAGDIPLWNSLSLSGMPLAANPLAMTFYPPNLLRSLLVVAKSPIDTYLSLYMLSLFHALVLALGMYGLARHENLTFSTSLMVAIATTFSSRFLTSVVTNISFIYGVAWTPVILLCLNKALQAVELRRRVGWLVVGGLLYGLQILAGLPQVALYGTAAYVLYVVMRVVVPGGEFAFPWRETVRRLTGWAGAMIFFGLIGALVASVLILPATELFRMSARAPEHYERFTHASGLVDLKFSFILSSLKKSFWDEPSLDAARKLLFPLRHWMFSLNLGLLIAAAAAVFAQPKRRVVIYGLMLYLLLDLCIGSPMPIARVFEAILFSASAPRHGSIILIVPLGILAGFGVEAVFSRVSNGKLPPRIVLYLLCTGLLLIVFVREPTGSSGGWSYQWALIPLSILMLMSFCSTLKGVRHIVIALMVAESVVCSREIVEHAFDVWPSRAKLEELTQSPSVELTQARSISRIFNHQFWSLQRAMNGYDPLILDSTIRVLCNPGEENIYRRYMSMRKNLAAVSFLKRPFWLTSAYVNGGLPDKHRPFPPTRVVFLNDASDLPIEKLTLRDVPRSLIADPQTENVLWSAGGRSRLTFFDVVLPQRNSALFVEYTGRAPARFNLGVRGHGDSELLVFQGVEIAATDHASATIEIPLPDFDKVNIYVKLYGPTGNNAPMIHRVSIVSDLSDEADLIHVIRDTPDLTILNVRDAPGPRALVFTDAAYPGWQAFVDGAPVPIYLANDAFKAVLVPKGTHEIRFEFRPWRISVGLSVSMATAIAAFLSLLWWFRRDQKSAPSTISLA